MTDDELEAIAEVERLRAEREQFIGALGATQEALVEARAQLAAMRPIVEAVAKWGDDSGRFVGNTGLDPSECPYCQLPMYDDVTDKPNLHHKPDCPITLARAVLDRDTEQPGQEASE